MKYAILLLALLVSACANHAPRDDDSAANLAQIGAEAARIALIPSHLF